MTDTAEAPSVPLHEPLPPYPNTSTIQNLIPTHDHTDTSTTHSIPRCQPRIFKMATRLCQTQALVCCCFSMKPSIPSARWRGRTYTSEADFIVGTTHLYFRVGLWLLRACSKNMSRAEAVQGSPALLCWRCCGMRWSVNEEHLESLGCSRTADTIMNPRSYGELLEKCFKIEA